MNSIIERLKKMLFEITNRDFKLANEESSLFSNEYKLNPRDLVYLMLLIEREFGIVFSSEQINDFEFYTLEKISDAIISKQ